MVLHGDLAAAARALLRVPPEARAPLCRRMLDEAHWAHRYARRMRRAHAHWGDGSLLAAARRRVLAPEPDLGSDAYCACLALVLRCLVEWRAARRPRATGGGAAPSGPAAHSPPEYFGQEEGAGSEGAGL